jgi:hypothetical protein
LSKDQIVLAEDLLKIVRENAEKNHCCWHVQMYCQKMLKEAEELPIPESIIHSKGGLVYYPSEVHE